MANNVPDGAALLLALIRKAETSREDASAYLTIYGHREGKLTKPLTSMTLAEVQSGQAAWAKKDWAKKFGGTSASSAAGAYQFMQATLKDLMSSLSLPGSATFTPDLQDRLGFELLKRRGYADFVAGRITRQEFGKRLAQEWASFPVLANTQGSTRAVERGQSYYAGDGLNKALVAPETVEATLNSVLAADRASAPSAPPAPANPPAAVPTTNRAGIVIIGLLVVAAVVFFIVKH